MLSIPIHLLAVVLVLAQAKASQTIVGKWEALEPADDLRLVLEFRRDGRVFRSVGGTLSGNCRLDGNRILVEEGLTKSGEPSESMELRIETDALVMKVEDDELRFLKRLNRRAPNVPATVGKWGVTFPFFHGGGKGLWTIELTADGQCRSRIQSEAHQKGRYKTRGNIVIIKDPDETRTSSYRFENGFLILKSHSKPGSEEKYKRIE